MLVNELREKYLTFFEGHGHTRIPSHSLIPENDPTALFTMAGVHPLETYVLGEPHPAGARLVNFQKCIRTTDIEKVGDPSHVTLLEMLGNWSLGDYFKEEAIRMSFEFLTSKKWLGFPVGKLYVTVFRGDEAAARDEEAARLWRAVGVAADHIHYLGEDNWWGPAGQTGPCGPTTEMYIDMGSGPVTDETLADPERFFEIWNNVFMQYNKTADGEFIPLDRTAVDTGMGMERTAAMLQGFPTVYEIETLRPLIGCIEERSGKQYGASESTDQSMRIVADHARAAAFILGDERGVLPSNLGQGYVLRRIIRRAIRHCRKLGIDGNFLAKPGAKTVEICQDYYPEMRENQEKIVSELTAEEERFLETLRKGEHEFARILPGLQRNPRKVISGRVAFRLYDTFGFPLEITQELAAENGLTVEATGFEEAFSKHQELSKAGAVKTFKGGLADNSQQVTRLHTATHLLHQALRDVLGAHVQQKGSNITAERLRFDFSHPSPLSSEEVAEVERRVNQAIERDLPVSVSVMALDQAKAQGAMALFGEKYQDTVKVYSIGEYSTEVCGGPHVTHTAELGKFKIAKEQSSSAGVRRIRAVLESA